MIASERFVEVAGRRLWTRTIGAGPSVLLGSGAGRAGVGQAPVIEAMLAQFATVISYDRAGTGRSDPPPVPPRAGDMADDLAAVLDALDIAMPVLLTGFSLSALPCQLFACRRPADVSGLLLLDPTPDDMVAAIADWPAEIQEVSRRNLISGPNVAPAMALEMEGLIDSAIEVREAIRARGLPDIPYRILAIERPGGAGLREHHEAMAARARQGRLVIVPGDGMDGHAGFFHDQGEMIVRMVREMLAREP
ncbi:MAG: alpha/beta fold hydrolase [Sphingobium sp.]|nr:alpha/beta fold hydrolase [Sphingobium sp.]